MKKILYISCLDQAILKKMRLKNDSGWLIKAAGINRKKLHICFAQKNNLPKLSELKKYQKIIIGGGRHSAFERLAWIKKLSKIIRYSYNNNLPTLGICFGHQLIAQTLGGHVKTQLNKSERGNINIQLTKEGAKNNLFKNVPIKFQAFGSHDDMIVRLPKIKGLKILAKNKGVPYQALSYGHNFYSVQFHPEFTPEIMRKINFYFFKKNNKYTALSQPKKILRNFLKILL